MDNLPSVTFVVLAEKDSDRLVGCLETIARQEYPARLVETIIVGDRGVETAEIARRFNAAVIGCDRKDAAARVNLAIGNAKSDIVFAIGADGGLSRTDWILLMIRPFVERPEVAGVFTQIVESPTDGPLARYLSRINGEPFIWFVHGDKANPRNCRTMYRVAGSGEGYVIYLFPNRRPPLVPADHGIGVRRSVLESLPAEGGTAAPLVRLVEGRQPVALVPDAGIHHRNVDEFRLLMSEYYDRLLASPDGWPECFEQHFSHRSAWRRARRYLFVVYGLTVVMPLLDGVWLSLFEKNTCMLWHGPVAIAEGLLILVERTRRLAHGTAAQRGQGQVRTKR